MTLTLHRPLGAGRLVDGWGFRPAAIEEEGTEHTEAGAVAFALTAVGDIGIPPIVTVWTVTDITDTDAWSGGTIVKAGSSSITARGVCWNTTGNPTIADDHTHD